MSEQDAIILAPSPRTRVTLAEDFRALGIRAGGVLLVHSSLSALGWVAGGAQTVIDALLDVLGPQGTLVTPTHSADLSDPAKWCAPPVPPEWIETIRATMPAFDPARTPTRGMGRIPELFRTWPQVQRSLHPTCSFAAFGPQAPRITKDHALEQPFGEASPLARLYELNADILLLGVGYKCCTAFHLAEYRACPGAVPEIEGAPVLVDGMRRWITYQTQPLDVEPFPAIGEWLFAQGVVKAGRAGSADCRHMPLRQTVDLATTWLSRVRGSGPCTSAPDTVHQ